jgi:outer membrane protein OmpA-like peptidoglycan-associated protein
MTACVVANDAAVPMLDLRALVADASTERDAPTISFSLESDFSHRFLRQDVEVVEIEAGSSLYALPGDEVTDVLDLPSVILVPGRGRDGRRPCGVAVYQGQPILVLGLAGTNTLYGQTGVVVRNGTFACIVAGARIRDRRTIPMGSQRALPMPPPSGTVYGCYVEGDGVVLILNVAAIAISGGDERLGGSRTETQVWRQDMVIPWATWVPEARAGREIARADAGPVVPEERVGEERVSDRNTEVADVPSDSPVAQDAVALADPGRTETPPVEVAAGESEDPGLAVIEDNALAVESPKEEAPYVPAAADKPVPSSRSRRRRPGAWLAPAAILSAVVIGGLILLRPPARSQTTPAIAGVPASQAAEARGAKASQTEAGVPTGAEGLTPVMSPPGPEVTAVLPVTVVYFAADSAVIELSAATLLDDLAAAMARMPGRPVPVLITGHTALAETPELRRALSLQRAQAVRDYLVGRMPESSILARCVGVGAEEPASTNDTPQNMSLNRRAVIQVPGEP